MSFGSSAPYPRALTEAELARWVLEWNDNGLMSWDIMKYMILLLIVAVPLLFLYWSGFKLLVSPSYRQFIRSGTNGLPVVAFGFGWFVLTAILNDVFFAVLFEGPLWAAVYTHVGDGFAIEVEKAVSLVRASAILFGAWD